MVLGGLECWGMLLGKNGRKVACIQDQATAALIIVVNLKAERKKRGFGQEY